MLWQSVPDNLFTRSGGSHRETHHFTFLKENHHTKKNISRNPLWPDWYNGKKIDEVQFGRAFLEQWPLKCVNGTLYTLDGPVEDESEIKQRILENIEEYVTSGLSKKVTNILETIKLLAFSDPFPIEQDCIHLQNGVYHLPDGTFQESRLFCQNRLPVKYDPKAPTPDRWLTFLHELLDDADIPTLQEYLGYCLIPSTKGQKMMLIVGKGGEGKSRIGLVLKRLMGDAASNGSVQKVENNRFARADLERRLLMIDDDMDMNALPKTNYIKTIVTAEAKLDLERKGVQSYQRDIYARFLCFGNGALTSLYDHSDGFFRRQLILTTKDKPTDRMDDPFLVEKMCAELEGILLWCLEGLHRLVQNDFRFTVSERAAANVDTIKRSSNNVIDFMESEGYFRFKADYSTSSKEFYDILSSGARTTPATAYRRSVSARNCDRTTAAITLKPPTTSICPVAAGCGVSWASSRLSTPARKKCIFLRKKFVQPVRSVLVRTCTANRDKLKRGIVYISDFCTLYRPYGLFEVRTDFLYTPRRSVIYESPIRHFKVQKVQGACHQPHRSPQRAHQGAVRQQPGYRHEPEPLQPPSGAAAGQVPGRS